MKYIMAILTTILFIIPGFSSAEIVLKEQITTDNLIPISISIENDGSECLYSHPVYHQTVGSESDIIIDQFDESGLYIIFPLKNDRSDMFGGGGGNGPHSSLPRILKNLVITGNIAEQRLYVFAYPFFENDRSDMFGGGGGNGPHSSLADAGRIFVGKGQTYFINNWDEILPYLIPCTFIDSLPLQHL